MSRHGLRVDPGGKLNKKPTGILCNNLQLARFLPQHCVEGNQRALKAQVHTPQFCRIVLRGLCKVLEHDGVMKYPQGKKQDFYHEPVLEYYSEEVRLEAETFVTQFGGDFIAVVAR
eukprot:451250-Alexandrium_andersonii.AAC.1